MANQTGRGESRKVDQIIHAMGQYNGALQAKWFGSNVYRIAGAIVLTSGRSLPPSNEPMQRGEGVTLVLCGDAIVGRLLGNNGNHRVVGWCQLVLR